MVRRWEVTVADPSTPDLALVHRGALALTTALRISTLLPREQEAIFSILHSLNRVDQQLRRQEQQPDSNAYAAALLVTIVDTYRRELANLARGGA